MHLPMVTLFSSTMPMPCSAFTWTSLALPIPLGFSGSTGHLPEASPPEVSAYLLEQVFLLQNSPFSLHCILTSPLLMIPSLRRCPSQLEEALWKAWGCPKNASSSLDLPLERLLEAMRGKQSRIPSQKTCREILARFSFSHPSDSQLAVGQAL